MNDDTTPRTLAQDPAPSMLKAALWYAGRGYSIFPVHEPKFDRAEQLVGCTCEAYRRTEQCKCNHPALYLGPAGRCAHPGKCPRVKWRDSSTTDAGQIRQWWSWWPTANIGIDCGKSGLLALDADLYKDAYAGPVDLDENTVTTLTGGGGVHLWYAMPEGALWGNAKGDLPPGIDIRGHGGYVVAPPSLHASGRRYTFEHGFAPWEVDLLPVPAELAAILDAAQSGAVGTIDPHIVGGCVEPLTPADLAVLQRGLSGAQGEEFAHLYAGQWQQGYVNNWGRRQKWQSKSEADFSLLRQLAYLTNGDSVQMARLFMNSPMYEPNRRGDPAGYLRISIQNAIKKRLGRDVEAIQAAAAAVRG